MLKHTFALTALIATTAAAQTEKNPSPAAEARACYEELGVDGGGSAT